MPKSEKKRKRRGDEEDEAGQIDAMLAAHGERFLQMFEPTEVDRRAASPSDDATASASSHGDDSDSEGSYATSSDDEDAGAADAAVDRIFAGGAKAAAAAAGRQRDQAPKAVASPALPRPMDPEIAKLERKRFMSHKADVVAGAAAVAPPQRGRAKAEDASAAGGLTKEEFEKLKREVHMYGEWLAVETI